MSARMSKGHSATDAVTRADPVLVVDALSAHYGGVCALDKVSVEVHRGQLVALVGSNGAGKTTLLRSISGLHGACSGRLIYEGSEVGTMRAAQRVSRGIAHVPEGRMIFAPMTVEDNLRLGSYTRRDSKVEISRDLKHVYELFPALAEKRSVAAGTLSGGQQQMLAIGRALMSRPRLLLLDEPSMGLAPLLVAEVFDVVKRLKADGMTILVVEQNATAALALADYAYVLEAGRIVCAGAGHVLCNDPEVRRAYFGV